MMDTLGKLLRILAIALMGLTAAFTTLGGLGTICVAFFTEKYPSLMVLYPYRWLYQILTVITLGLGLAGIWATYRLARGRRGSYNAALAVLLAGALTGGIKMAASLSLRGSAAPTNMRVYFTLFTVLVFLLLGLPGVWRRVGLERPRSKSNQASAGGLTALLAGLLVLSTALWAGPSHSVEGVNWVLVLEVPLSVAGGGLILGGLVLLAWARLQALRPAHPVAEAMAVGAD